MIKNTIIKKLKWILTPSSILLALLSSRIYSLYASETTIEPIQACVIARDAPFTPDKQARIAHCLGWQEEPGEHSICLGNYRPIVVAPLATPDEIHLEADKVSFYNQGQSELSGNVQVQQSNRIVNAQTAYVYRDSHSNQVTRIELLGPVRYLEPDRLMIARKATLYPQTKAGEVEDVLYRFNFTRASSNLPIWGQASRVKRFPNEDYLLEKTTYSTCSPQDYAWHIEADHIYLDQKKSVGTARNAKLVLGKVPLLYTPYLSFPISDERKSGFLMPTIGSSNVGGLDFALPYYLNLAPNYDATLIPHVYTRRGVMLGGQFRYLSEKSVAEIGASYLPQDRAYRHFLEDNQLQYPQFAGTSSDRWAVQVHDLTHFTPNLHLKVNFQQVSDDYYLQDFTSNLAILTERQLIREGELTYNTDHWIFNGLVQSYQTLQPINESFISNIYQRLPQLRAEGNYDELWFNAHFSILGQMDQFDWPNSLTVNPEGQRYHLNPILSFPHVKPWGFFTPSAQVVENDYNLNNYSWVPFDKAYDFLGNDFDYPPRTHPYNEFGKASFQRTIPRYSLDTGLFFDRDLHLFSHDYVQTLEPRLYYLYVPYRNQSAIPVFDSAYMIFNVDQLFRTNRFSGFDRIGDANQLAYSLTSRWLSGENGAERANFTIGQLRYFNDRRVQLCQDADENCRDNPLTLGYLSTTTDFSPIATRFLYNINPSWVTTMDYVWNGATRSTYNTNIGFHYQPEFNHVINFAYTYLANGDITVLNDTTQIDPLHQASISFAWPFNERWSTLAAYNYNISKRYEMLSFFGVQYDTCCWALRLIGGRSFQSLSSQAQPQYNNNVYLQIQLKGLGSVGNSDPGSVIRTYLPGYVDSFHHS